MKRLFSLALICIMLTAMHLGCNSGAKTAPPSQGTAAPSNTTPKEGSTAQVGATETPVEKKQVYIFVKNRGDLSMWDSIAAGGDKAKVDFLDRADVYVVETTADIQACLTAMYEAADKGADLMYAGNDFADCILEVGAAFPKIAMFSAGNKGKMTENLERMYAFQVRNDACFLAGILAADVATSGIAGTSASGVIGFIGGKDETLNVQNQFLGYINGAKHFKPEVEIVYNYVGGWNDPDKARTQALAQYNDSKAEVIFTTAGASGNGAYTAAQEVEKFAVGADVDMEIKYADRREVASRIITSTMVNYDVIVYNTIKKFLDEGSLDYGKFEFLGLPDGAVTCVEGPGFDKYISEDAKKAFNDAKDKILKGELEIPGALNQEQDVIKALINESLNK